VLRTVNDQPTLWDAILPAELLVLPGELARVDALLDDAVFFAPFARFFDPRVGRPSIPMETYLRLMFLKFRYRLGYESLCREVADSISWQRFARIPLGTRVPHPTTLMKITTRCGDAAVAGLNEALLAKAAAGKLLRTDKVRADTTVVEAAVAYPTDSGLLAKAVGRMARTIERIRAAGGATRTRARDRRRSAGRRARSIASKLRLRGAQQRDQAQATVRRITGELADLTVQAMREARAVLRNGRRALSTTTGRAKGRFRRALDELDTTLQRAARVVEQTRTRLSGQVPDGATRLVSLHDPDARPIRRGRLGSPVEFGYKAQIVDNTDGVILDHTIEVGNPPDAPQLVPAIERITRRAGRPPRAVTTDRGYGEARVERDLHDLGVHTVAIPRRANPVPPDANSNTDEPSTPWSNGAPDPRAASATSNAATDGTAPNSPPSQAPEPGADTASSPTTWSRSANWQAKQPHAEHPHQRPPSRTERAPTSLTTIQGFSGRSS
jgi:transposase, IS5 family